MIKLGYHVATWYGSTEPEDPAAECTFRRALAEMSEAGWDGFEVAGGPGGEVLESYLGREGEFKTLLDDHGLSLSCWYLSLQYADADLWPSEWEKVQRRADFNREAGADTLLIDGARFSDGADRSEQIRTVAERCNQIGEMARSKGLTAAWHQHFGTMFETQEPFERFLELVDPTLVRFCPDTAQLTLGDYDTPAFIEKHVDRVDGYVHFKDLDSERRFIELGAGTIDFPRVWRTLAKAGFNGWIVVDLDYTKFRAAESSRMNKRYLNEVLGIRGGRELGAEAAT